jgi:hypothetical protein
MQDKIVSPHLICLSEHHLKIHEITKFSLNNYKIDASFVQGGSLKRRGMYYGKA